MSVGSSWVAVQYLNTGLRPRFVRVGAFERQGGLKRATESSSGGVLIVCSSVRAAMALHGLVALMAALLCGSRGKAPSLSGG